MRSANTMPPLGWPFAVVGGAGGWLVAAVLANPMVELAAARVPELAAAVAALVGAAVGALLRRWCSANGPAESATALRVAMVVLPGGALAGALIGLATWQNPVGFGKGLGAGLLGGVLLLPVAWPVARAAERARRARMGSLVASCDRREILATLASALAVSTLLALPDWPASTGAAGLDAPGELAPRPFAPAAGAAIGLAVTALMMVRDLRARAALRGIAAAQGSMTAVDDPDLAPEDVPTLDLGLGDATFATVAREGFAYRARDRTVALMIGAPRDAASAVRAAIVRKLAGIALGAAALAAHAIAAGPASGVVVGLWCWDRGPAASCLRAARLLETHRDGSSDRLAAADHYGAACDLSSADGQPLTAACARLAELLDTGGSIPSDLGRAALLRERACAAGDGASCLALTGLLERGGAGPRELRRAAMVLRRACDRGVVGACTEARIVERQAPAEEVSAAGLFPGEVPPRSSEGGGGDTAALSPVRDASWFELGCARSHGLLCLAAAWRAPRAP